MVGTLVYALNVLCLAAYQEWVLGGANLPYVVLAPIIPSIVVSVIVIRSAGQAMRRGLDAHGG